MKNLGKNTIAWVLILASAILMYNFVASEGGKQTLGREVAYTEFLNQAEKQALNNVVIQGDTLIGQTSQGEKIRTTAPYDPELIATLRQHKVSIQVKAQDTTPGFGTVLLSWVPTLLLIGVWIFFMRQMNAGGNKAMSFGKSRAQMRTENDVKVRFGDVAGCDEAKTELQEVVEFLKDPQKFTKLGGRIPKGVLLVGSPGTGKTLLAKSVAGEAGVPFFSISGSDFVEMFVGVGAARVRDLFEQGKRSAPCIIFIDEIDAVGRHRGTGIGGGNDEREQTLNQLLVEMDGFESNDGVILVAATNRPDVLDPALLRPGRFDRQVVVPLPDVKGREAILAVHAKKVPLSTDVEVNVLARGTPGFAGADLANLVNEAALIAARRGKRLVDMDDFEYAKDKIMMGAERRNNAMTPAQKKTTAYHEAGHAIVAMNVKGEVDPLHKITIIPRGRALGVTMQLPKEDKVTYDKIYLENQIAILMGGRLAEELVLNQQTTGASNDIERATDLARRMVCHWGMSSLGPLTYGDNPHEMFLGRELQTHRNLSENMAQKIDAEVRTIVDRNYVRAESIVRKNLNKLHLLSEALLEYETLDKEQVDKLFSGQMKVKTTAEKTKPKAKTTHKTTRA